MLEMQNFGKTSFKEVKKKLSEMGLTFGMDMDTIFADKKSAAGGRRRGEEVMRHAKKWRKLGRKRIITGCWNVI